MTPCFCTDCNKVQPWHAGHCTVCGKRVFLNRRIVKEKVVEFLIDDHKDYITSIDTASPDGDFGCRESSKEPAS